MNLPVRIATFGPFAIASRVLSGYQSCLMKPRGAEPRPEYEPHDVARTRVFRSVELALVQAL